MLYRVKRADQVLPSAVLEFEMKPLRIHVPQPVCELCEALPATLFCPADRAHLCDECDERVHSSTRMLARHTRVPATHVSPPAESTKPERSRAPGALLPRSGDVLHSLRVGSSSLVRGRTVARCKSS